MTESQYPNTTLIDVQLAAAYYPILIDLAKHKHLLTYQELVERAKAEYSENKVVQNAIPVSTGRRLDVVRIFTTDQNLPDLSSLIISKSTGEVGKGHLGDAKAQQQKAFAYDWSDESPHFDIHIKTVTKAITQLNPRTLEVAKKLMVDYIKANGIVIPKEKQRSVRAYVLEGLQEGLAVEDVFEKALKAV